MPKDHYYRYGKSPGLQKRESKYVEDVDRPLRKIDPYTMPFGKYKGVLFGKIPVDYLEYILSLDNIDQTLKNRILSNIRYRKDNNVI